MRPFNRLDKCWMRRVAEDLEVMELCVEDDGDDDLLALSPGDCIGELSESIDGAVGSAVVAGTEAKYSAPELGMFVTLPTRSLLLLNVCVGDRSSPRSSKVRVRCRGTAVAAAAAALYDCSRGDQEPLLEWPFLLELR